MPDPLPPNVSTTYTPSSLPAMQLSPRHSARIDLTVPGLADLINKILAAGIPGLTWQNIVVVLVENFAPQVLSWLEGIWQQWKQGTLQLPVSDPSGNPLPT